MCGQETRADVCALHSGRWEERTRVRTSDLRICHDRGLCIPNLISFRRFFIKAPQVNREWRIRDPERDMRMHK